MQQVSARSDPDRAKETHRVDRSLQRQDSLLKVARVSLYVDEEETRVAANGIVKRAIEDDRGVALAVQLEVLRAPPCDVLCAADLDHARALLVGKVARYAVYDLLRARIAGRAVGRVDPDETRGRVEDGGERLYGDYSAQTELCAPSAGARQTPRNDGRCWA